MRLWTTWSTAISVHIWNVNNVAKYLKKSIMIKMSQKSRLRATFNRQFYRSCGIRNASYVMMPRLINCTSRQAFLREKSTSDVTFASFEQWVQLKRHSRSLANWCIMHCSLVSYRSTTQGRRQKLRFAAHRDVNMAEGVNKYDLGSLFLENKSLDIDCIRRNCEMKSVAAISQAKIWNPFTKGVHGRDLAAELLIPKHITAKWQHKCGELRALK